MNEYRIDLNAVDRKPLILYNSDSDVVRINDCQVNDCWRRLHENSSAPLESLLLKITAQEGLRLRYTIDVAREAGTVIPDDLLKETEAVFHDKCYWLMEGIIREGIPDLDRLRGHLSRFYTNMEMFTLDQDNLTNTFIYSEEEQAAAAVAAKIKADAPAAEIVQTINDGALVRFFHNSVEDLPENFDQARIAQVINNDFPIYSAYSEFLRAFLQKFKNNYVDAKLPIENPIFQLEEVYRNFPGIKPGRLWAETENLKAVDLENRFDLQAIEDELRRHPEGFKVVENDSHPARVVLPHRQNLNVQTGIELFPAEPLESEIQNIFFDQNQAPGAVFLELFDEFLELRIENSFKRASRLPMAAGWLIICQEALAEINSDRKTKQLLTQEQKKQLTVIGRYLKKQLEKIPKDIYTVSMRERWEARRQQNIAKCLELNEALRRELISAQTSLDKNLKPAGRQIAQLGDLVNEQEQIIQARQGHKEASVFQPQERDPC